MSRFSSSTPVEDDLEGKDPLRRESEPQRFAFSKNGVVSSQHWLASEAGARVLSEGGNAIDAAVTTAFALAVCEPQASGLGGQTCALIYDSSLNKTLAIDGSSRAPNRAVPGSISSDERLRGYRATTVPATPASLSFLLERYGSFTLAKALGPAIDLADRGFPVSELLSSLMNRESKRLRKFSGGQVFLKNGKPYKLGERLCQPALANTLKRLGKYGVKTFYTGKVARLIHEDMQKNGGLLHKDDLARPPWPIVRRPISTRFRGRRVVTFPPPGAGRALIEILNILSEFSEKELDIDTPRGAAILAGAIRAAAGDRQDRPRDPTYYQQSLARQMISSELAKSHARNIRKKIKTRGETTHLSVMDSSGNVVTLTQSIERVFGSCVITPELGFLYNNYMSAFEFEDISHPYFMRPNAVPWASVAPTIVFKGRRPWLALGSPGSERIVSSIAQVLLRLGNQTPFDAVAAPRLHCSLEGKVSLEASRFRNDVSIELERLGYTIDRREALSFYLGCVQLVIRDRTGYLGVADPRRDGSAEAA